MDRAWLMARAGHIQQWGGTRLVALEDGTERGVRTVEFRTSAGLEFAVLVDRGMDVGRPGTKDALLLSILLLGSRHRR